MNRWAYIWPVLILLSLDAWSQQHPVDPLPGHLKETGFPIIQNYQPDVYQAFDQNWDFTQDSTGILYVANGDGVLIYDGVNWDLLPLPNNGTVFSIATDAPGTVYVGAHNELGFLVADSLGRLQYQSLMPHLDSLHRDFNIIWNTFSTDQGVYFSARTKLMRWDGDQFKVWHFEGTVSQFAHNIGHKVLLHRKDVGLMELVHDEFQLVPGGEYFSDNEISELIPMGQKRYLIVARNNLYLYDGLNFTKFPIDKEDFFEENRVYCGTLLRDSTIALGSLNKGILIVDRLGRQRTLISQEGQLSSNQVYALYQDDSGLLWAALFSGIAKIETPSPFSLFTEWNQLPGVALAIHRHQGVLFVGTSQGLYYLNPEARDPTFTEVPQIKAATFDLVSFGDQLLVGASGVYQLEGNHDLTPLFKKSVHTLHRSSLDSNRVFVGLSPGLLALKYEDDYWKEEYYFEDVKFAVHTIAEENDGTLWLRTNANNIVRVSFNNEHAAGKLENPQLTTFDQQDGFPDDIGIPYLLDDHLYFVTSTGQIFLFDRQNQLFKADSSLLQRLGMEVRQTKITEIDEHDNVWGVVYQDGARHDQWVAWKQQDGSYVLDYLQEYRIMALRRNGFLEELADSIIWYKGQSGLVRHDLRSQLDSPVPKVLIRKVFYKADSSLYAGFGRLRQFNLPFLNNSFRFYFTSPSFYQEEVNEYQYKLEGFDPHWSAWTSESQKDYTNIPEGKYTFKVRSRNIFGQISNEALFQFNITPPWHRTWWAYTLYVLVALGLVMAIVKWRSRQLQREKIALEATIKDRTEEIRQKNYQLQGQTSQLAAQTEKLKEVDHMKSRLFANISHEFRTPLTLIKGPIDQLEQQPDAHLSMENIKMMRRNTERLLRLVTQLLDLSKLDAGSLKVELAEGDTFKCLRSAASAFSSHAAQRNLDYQIKIPSRLLWASFDRDKIEKIVYNLLSNAFKFTFDEGMVIISADHADNLLKISVEDTGKGIPRPQLDHIFDRFYQVDDSHTRVHEGSGIGLALIKELVDLMQGNITVNSLEQQGTSFQVNLPLLEIRTSGPKPDLTLDITPAGIHPPQNDVPQSLESSVWDTEIPTILIAEDNVDMRDYIGQQLKTYYNIVEAINGQDGWEKAQKLVPDLIITDIMMPQMDGTEMCRCIKSHMTTSHIPVIMLTAKAGQKNKIKGLDIGADDYLIKPFDAQELQVRVRNLIEQRRHLRQLFSQGINTDPKEITVTSLDQKFLQKTLDLLEARYQDGNFGVPQLQESLALGKTQLHRKIKALTDQPPGELLRNFRLKRAAQILSGQGDSVTQVAYAVGFNNLSYFAKCFKELHGCSPSQYLAEAKKAP